ncbi:MAG TPA: prolyl oligopeptidase family serine peptidase [Candidatus Limnocylindrales bacterium]|nr:prolyl oligopeptidase family serine peptidase [Candidatus Limnocylindrales bacterium]
MRPTLVVVLALIFAGLAAPASGVVTFPSGSLTLHGVLYKPAGKGPFPAVLFNHGSAPGMYSQEAFDSIAPLFTQAGWIFFAPWRRGQGLSANAGPYIGDQITQSMTEGGIPAASATMVHLLETQHLQDQLAGLAWLRKQSFVDAKRIAVAGNSFGGIETLLGAEKESYCAAVDIAGGAESWKYAPQLQSSLIRAATHAQAPVLFVQAENDYDLAPSNVLSEAARKSGKTVEVKIYPPFGKTAEDGHSISYRGASIWQPDALRFLERNCRAH